MLLLRGGKDAEMKNSAISWTTHTANFWQGCFKVSDGCTHCYAESLSKRYGKDIWGPAKTTPRVRGIGIWKDILKWDREAKQAGKRERVFVSSMSDFLEDHPMVTEWRNDAIKVIESLEWLDVLILTKRPENAPKFLARWYDGGFPDHVWMGTSVESQPATERISDLVIIPAPIHFLSVEPMLGPVTLSLPSMLELEWVIVGGESGAKHRPFEWDWARDLRNQCQDVGIAFWMKQGGGHPNKRHELADIPEDLRIRELPQ
jgi:protein gp37